MMNPKKLSNGNCFRPDIIVHSRLRNDKNVLVVEAKSIQQNGAPEDIEKWRELTAEHGDYRYWAGAFVLFYNESTVLIQNGTLRVTIEWFPQAAPQIPTEITHSIPNKCNRHEHPRRQ